MTVFRREFEVALPRRALLKDEKSLMELIARGGVHVNPAATHKLGELIRKKRDIWLELTVGQHAKLKGI